MKFKFARMVSRQYSDRAARQMSTRVYPGVFGSARDGFSNLAVPAIIDPDYGRNQRTVGCGLVGTAGSSHQPGLRPSLTYGAGHYGASQLTIHFTPNLSVTIPNSSAQ